MALPQWRKAAPPSGACTLRAGAPGHIGDRGLNALAHHCKLLTGAPGSALQLVPEDSALSCS